MIRQAPHRFRLSRVPTLLAALVGLLALPGCLPGQVSEEHPHPFRIHFLDVGQGDAVLIQAPTGQNVLIDAGPGVGVVDQLRALGVEGLELFIASHNHADHIGGAAAVLRAFPVGYFMDNGIIHTTATYERLLQAVLEMDVPLLEPERRTIGVGEGVLEILPSPGAPALGHNDNSLGVILRFGEFRAIFPGDAEPRLWRFWLDTSPEVLSPVQLHKASHHGSRNGDVEAAMERLRPEVVVVSAGRDNRYGHPHPEAVALYRGVGARVMITGDCGTITVLAARNGSFDVDPEACGRSGS